MHLEGVGGEWKGLLAFKSIQKKVRALSHEFSNFYILEQK